MTGISLHRIRRKSRLRCALANHMPEVIASALIFAAFTCLVTAETMGWVEWFSVWVIACVFSVAFVARGTGGDE